MLFNVFIIGCGSIGAIKEDKYDNPDTKYPLTWAHAFYKYRDQYSIQLYFIDKDEEKAKKAAKKWKGTFISFIDFNASVYCNLRMFHSGINIPSIFVISTPTETHKEILEKILEFKPSFVIAEKPFTNDLKSAKYIASLYKAQNIPIMINYLRRHLMTTTILKSNIKNNIFGEIQQCKVTYTRGFKRDASHALDLCLYFFGQCEYRTLLDKHNALYDYSMWDASFNAYLRFEKCKNVFITAIDGRKFDLFEIDIIGSNSRIILTNHGKQLEIYRVIPEPLYGDYDTLSANKVICDTDLENALFYAAGNILEFLQKKIEFKEEWCTPKEAIDIHRIFEGLGI